MAELLDNSKWTKAPYVYQILNDFTTANELLAWLMSPGAEFADEQKYLETWGSAIAGMSPEFYLRPNQSDTSVGGNDAINCYWQFCENDDIIHPLNAIGGTPNAGGLGRVYSETYDRPQQIVHLTMGVPQFGSLTAFYGDMIDAATARFVNGVERAGLGSAIGKIAGRLLGTAISVAGHVVSTAISVAAEVAKTYVIYNLCFAVPYLPQIYLFGLWPAGQAVKAANSFMNTERVTRYYDFRSMMPMYYRYVNSILAHLSVNMGLIPDGDGGDSQGQFNSTYRKLWKAEDTNPLAVPEILRKGPDMFRILSKRDERINPGSVGNVDSDDYLNGTKNENEADSWFSGFVPRLTSSVFGADKFVGFRIEKSVDSSESIGNNTGESTVAQMLNSRIAQAKDFSFKTFSGKFFDEGIISDVINTVKSFLENVTDGVAFSGLGSALMTGSGFADIPEVWQGSSFSKSYSFSMTLRAPYGDPVSVFQAIYIPLACLLAAALPRSVGRNAYTAPFLVRAYCKGMFAIPLGIIDSMSIKRGASEFGWSTNQLPTVVEVSFTIKDLAPVMHMAMMGGNTSFFDMFSQNSSFQEYLLTLSGMGLNERLIWFEQIKRKFETSFQMMRTTWTSPLWWATNIGNAGLPRLLGTLSGWNRYGNK